MGVFSAIVGFFKAIGTAWKAASTLKKIGYVIQAFTLAVGVKGFMQARQMLAKGQDILANKTSAGGKLPVIYGTRRVGTQIIYMDTNANDSRDLYVVYALAVGECEEILGRTIELDGNPLTDSARFRDGGYIGSDKINSGSGSLNTVSQNGTGTDVGNGGFGTSPTAKYRYVMNLHHGAATQTADPMLVASMSNWTSAHKLNGVCYIAAHYGYDKKGMWSGVPQLTVQVKGKKVFDPRDSNQTFGTVSTYEWSDNVALCFLDYITNDEYGKGLPIAKVNTTTFSTAANVAEGLQDNPYYNGTAKSINWSGTAGSNFILVPSGQTNAGIRWWQNKVGENITLTDTAGNVVLNSVQITGVSRNRYYDASAELVIFVNATLGATYAEQTGTILAKVKRFHCNGYLDANKSVMDNAKELLANMRVIFLYVDGKYELQIEDTGSSSFSITDDHVIADAGISVDYGDKDQRANKVIIEFFNANKKYELDTAIILHSATTDANDFTSDDGGEELEIKAEFPYVSDPYIAHNMGKAILTRSRNQTTIQFLGTPEMYKLNVGDIVTFTYAGLGFNGKVCRVEGLELQSDGLVSVSLIEYFDVYTWEVPAQEPVEELADLPSAYAVKAPTGLAFTDTDSSSTGRPFLSWNEPTDFPDYEYRVNVIDSSGNQVVNKIVDVTNCDLNFLPVDSNYVANVSAINTLGSESSVAALTFTIGNAPVITNDLKDSVVTELKIAADAVTNAKIAVDAIQGDVIAAGAITEQKLGVDAVTSAKIADNAINSAQIAADAVITAKIADDAVTNALIATDAVNQDSIAANAVTATQIVAGTITASEIASSAITTAKIATGAITAGKIGAGEITANEIKANTITANQIASNAITTDELAANSITSAKIVANTITASDIASDTITATEIAAGAIATDQLAAGAVVAAKITSGTITALQIASDAITTDKILANQVTATKINVTDLILPSNGGLVAGSSIGNFNNNSKRYAHAMSVGSGAGFYIGYVRLIGGTGQVKGISMLFSDGTFGASASNQINTTETSGGTDTTKLTDNASSPFRYVTPDLEKMMGLINESRLTSSADTTNIPLAFRYTGSGTVNLFIYGQGDGNALQIGSADARFIKFSAS